jgi:arsenate reductase
MTKPMVLVLCTGNSCRSQMAEGFLRKYHGEAYDVASAGTDPKPEVHPLAARVMGEIGIDISAGAT